MKPLERVYWMRLGLGAIAALLCTGYSVVTGTVTNNFGAGADFTSFFNGASIAFVVYIFSYYVIKFKYKTSVQKPQKLVTTGIGVYFLAWLVFWVLFYTVLAGSP